MTTLDPEQDVFSIGGDSEYQCGEGPGAVCGTFRAALPHEYILLCCYYNEIVQASVA